MLTFIEPYTGLIVFGVFFYRWNDGYENVFSSTYRWQLRMRDAMFGNLTEQQREDLEAPKQRGMTRKMAGTSVEEPVFVEPKQEDITLQRPQRVHYIEAERIRQEREEAILRAVDIAEEQVRKQKEAASSSGTDGSKKSGWKFW